MTVNLLNVKYFRNILSADFQFSPNVNIISGNNAQGKTNLVEAIACCTGKSFRSCKSVDMLTKGQNAKSEIQLSFTLNAYPNKINELNCSISQKGIFRKINGIDYKEALQLYPQLKTVVFVPEDLYFVKGNPQLRRELLDDTAHMMNKIHSDMTLRYLKALKQKNTFLSGLNGKISDSSQNIQLEIWNSELAKSGINVLCGRLKYFSTFCKYTSQYYSELSNSKEILTMQYNNSVFDDLNFDITQTDKMLSYYTEKLEKYREKELLLGHTLIGVHRDDLSFFINGENAKDFASQGQVRSIAVAVRLAQAKMFYQKWGEPPVIILDDVLSELDKSRREFILQHIDNSQVFITGCNNSDFSSIADSFNWIAINGSFTKI